MARPTMPCRNLCCKKFSRAAWKASKMLETLKTLPRQLQQKTPLAATFYCFMLLIKRHSLVVAGEGFEPPTLGL
jgi:hypothetical protein